MTYSQKIKRMSYEELLVEKAKLLSYISAYEKGIPEDHPILKEIPDPDRMYIHYLKYLSKVSQLLSEKYITVLSRKIKEKNKNVLY
ncbi:MAG: hypothetical protein J6D29_00715 [Solobacterium sp.]|nr:hypothetical protein [Solobacterium sp.]